MAAASLGSRSDYRRCTDVFGTPPGMRSCWLLPSGARVPYCAYSGLRSGCRFGLWRRGKVKAA
ncbi:hypothetical protein KCP74_14920 [Salmonella enterica subsp. enterica]|nr:hypothetical protein KCP74_14920 [Salmonella enterica subsp. enterica]